MAVWGCVIKSSGSTTTSSPIIVCSVERQGLSLIVRDLSTSQVLRIPDPMALCQLDPARTVGSGFALWNNEWSGLPRHWTMVYHPCRLQSFDNRTYTVLFDGDDSIREVPINIRLTSGIVIPGCIYANQVSQEFIDSVPEVKRSHVPCPVIPIDLDDVFTFVAPLDADELGSPLDPLEGVDRRLVFNAPSLNVLHQDIRPSQEPGIIGIRSKLSTVGRALRSHRTCWTTEIYT